MTKIFNNRKQKQLRRNLRTEMTKAEHVLWYYLRGRQINSHKFRRQASIGRYIVDFYCAEAKLVVEVDGDTHFEPEAEKYDQEREKYINSKGVKIIRFTNLDIYNNIEEVVKEIMKQCPE